MLAVSGFAAERFRVAHLPCIDAESDIEPAVAQ